MTREALADRVLTYCDALAAFSLVNAFAFLVTLGEPDIRCSIAQIAGVVIAANLVIPTLITVGLVLLRRFERSLRPGGSQDPSVERFWRIVQAVRLAPVWAVALCVSVGLWAARLDPGCTAAA